MRVDGKKGLKEDRKVREMEYSQQSRWERELRERGKGER